MQHVEGEVYDVDDRMLAVLDRLEFHPHWYTRQPCQIQLKSGEQTTCLVYFLLNFKPDLLKFNFLSNFHCESDNHPHYVPKEKRPVRGESLADVVKLSKQVNEHALKAIEEMLKIK